MNKPTQAIFSVMEDREKINEQLSQGWRIEGMLTGNIVLLVKESAIVPVSAPIVRA